MAGLVPAIHVLLLVDMSQVREFKQVPPIGIVRVNKAHLPRTRPVLDRLFTLNGGANIVVQFKIDELLQAMALRETRQQAVAVFMAPADEIAGHAT